MRGCMAEPFQNDDDCAIVAIAHGKVDPVRAMFRSPLPVAWIEVAPRVEFSVFSQAVENLPPGRAPPVFSQSPNLSVSDVAVALV